MCFTKTVGTAWRLCLFLHPYHPSASTVPSWGVPWAKPLTVSAHGTRETQHRMSHTPRIETSWNINRRTRRTIVEHCRTRNDSEWFGMPVLSFRSLYWSLLACFRCGLLAKFCALFWSVGSLDRTCDLTWRVPFLIECFWFLRFFSPQSSASFVLGIIWGSLGLSFPSLTDFDAQHGYHAKRLCLEPEVSHLTTQSLTWVLEQKVLKVSEGCGGGRQHCCGSLFGSLD